MKPTNDHPVTVLPSWAGAVRGRNRTLPAESKDADRVIPRHTHGGNTIAARANVLRTTLAANVTAFDETLNLIR